MGASHLGPPADFAVRPPWLGDAGRKGTKPLLVGIMPGNGRDRASAMDRVSATNVKAASRLQQSCEGAHFAGTFGLHRTQGLAGVGIIGMVGKLLLLCGGESKGQHT